MKIRKKSEKPKTRNVFTSAARYPRYPVSADYPRIVEQLSADIIRYPRIDTDIEKITIRWVG